MSKYAWWIVAAVLSEAITGALCFAFVYTHHYTYGWIFLVLFIAGSYCESPLHVRTESPVVHIPREGQTK